MTSTKSHLFSSEKESELKAARKDALHDMKVPDTDFLNDKVKEQLRSIFSKLEQKVVMATVVDSSLPKSIELKDFLINISELSPFIDLEIYEKGKDLDMEHYLHVDKYPIVSLLDHERYYTGVKFHGIPGGHVLNPFILALYNLGTEGQSLSENIAKEILSINRNINIKVFISLSGYLCPEVVASANRIALLNPKVSTEMIDIDLFPDLRKKYQIKGVPTIILNDTHIYYGAKKMHELIALINES